MDSYDLERVLILTADFGTGHKSVARTLKKNFEKAGIEVIVYDVYSLAYPKGSSIIKDLYIKSYSMPLLYKTFYYGIEKIAHKKVVGSWYRRLGKKNLESLIEEIKPDAIINTFPVMASEEIKKSRELDIPLFTIVTDFCVNRIWMGHQIDKFFIATEDMLEHFRAFNISDDKVKVSGIPLRENFEKSVEIRRIKNKYQLDVDKKIVLVVAGALGVMQDTKKICKKIANQKDVQVVVICGNNTTLHKDLSNQNLPNTHVLGFVEEIHELFSIATCMITKPGGITLSEALATKLPLILYNPVYGQERENAMYFDKKGIGVIAWDVDEAIQYTVGLIQDTDRIFNMKVAMDNLYRKDSASFITDEIIKDIRRSKQYASATYQHAGSF